jgi:hypothetical protein
MGEKIRDIQSIKIGDSSLMIELNEGYTASQGRLIHIQNKKIRYLLKETDFHHLSSMVLRAWSEFDYVKKHKVEQKSASDFLPREEISEGTLNKLRIVSQLFQSNGIEYRVLDIQNKIITIIVKEECLPLFKRVIKSVGGTSSTHPYGKEYGYKFIYQMVPFLLYEYDGLYLEVFCQLPCASLTPDMWMPLDRMIQNEIWTSEGQGDVQMCDVKCQYIYHLCWAIFFNKGFSPYALSFLKKNKSVLDITTMKDFLSVVFFNYSELLISQIKQDSFDTIIPNYYSFIDY